MKKKFGNKEAQTFILEISKVEAYVKGNFESLDAAHYANYTKMIKNISNISSFTEILTPRLLTIGRLQLLRRIVTKQIHFTSKVESVQYESCLITLNNSVIHNIEEIKHYALLAMEEVADEPLEPKKNKTREV